MRIPIADVFRDFCAFLLYPQTCIVCGEDSHGGRPLCEDCLESRFLSGARTVAFTHADPGRCAVCGRPLVSSAGLCTMCRTTPNLSAIDRIVPLYSYAGEGQELLNAWKTAGVRGLSFSFARCLAAALETGARDGPVTLVPVPPRPKKMREKGWDQIEELACLLERFFGTRVLRALVRTGGIQQKKLGRLARYSNLKGHICLKEGVSVPETVILLDDLMTTGSTLDACAGALKAAGCGKVYGLTLFFD